MAMYESSERQPSALVLRERQPGKNGETLGWLIVLVDQYEKREVLAILTCEVGLRYARSFAQIMAGKYGLDRVTEELLTQYTSSLSYNLQNDYN